MSFCECMKAKFFANYKYYQAYLIPGSYASTKTLLKKLSICTSKVSLYCSETGGVGGVRRGCNPNLKGIRKNHDLLRVHESEFFLQIIILLGLAHTRVLCEYKNFLKKLCICISKWFFSNFRASGSGSALPMRIRIQENQINADPDLEH